MKRKRAEEAREIRNSNAQKRNADAADEDIIQLRQRGLWSAMYNWVGHTVG